MKTILRNNKNYYYLFSNTIGKEILTKMKIICL